MRRRIVGVVFVLASAVAPSGAGASPLELFGFGGRSPALAGAGVADAEGFAAVYLNPAGLAFVKKNRLTLGTAATRFRLRVDGRRDPVDNGTAFIFGGAVPIPFGGKLAERVVLGLGFHIPNSALVRVDRPIVGEPTFVLLDNRVDSVAVQVAAGVRIGERVNVGAGVLILAALAGTITVSNDAAGAFVTRSEQRLVTNVAPIIGGHYAPNERLALGMTARGPSRSDYDIEVATDLTSIPLGLPEIAVAGNAQYDPAMLAVGARYRLRDDLTLLGDLEYRRWSAFPRPTENPVLDNPPPPAPGFSDTVVPRVAAEISREFGRARGRGRLGYAFFLSPAPEMKGEATLLDNHRHMLAGGVGVDVVVGDVPLTIDVWSQLHLLQRRKHQKTIGLTTITASGQMFAGGLTVGVEL